MVFVMDKELFITKRVENISVNGNKIKWMEKVHYIIQMIKLLMMGIGKMINFMVMELFTMRKSLHCKNLLIIKIGPWSNNIGSNMKVNSLWIINKVEANCIFQMDKFFRDGLKRTWLMDKEFWQDKMEVELEESGEKINFSECIENRHKKLT